MIVPNVTYHDQGSITPEKGDQIGQDAFLRLLLAQLAHQDPLSPMNSMEFTAQLAQFSQLEQMVSFNEKLDSLLLYQSSLNSWQGVEMIGKEVDAMGDWVELNDGSAGTIGYRLEQNCSQVTVQIFDQNGKLVRTLDQGPREKGENLIEWDGRDDDGTTLPDGPYTVAVTAGSGESVASIATFVRGMITGVSFEHGIPLLLMGNQEIPFASVMAVRSISEG